MQNRKQIREYFERVVGRSMNNGHVEIKGRKSHISQ